MEQQGPATLSAVPRTSPGPRGRLLRGRWGPEEDARPHLLFGFPEPRVGKPGFALSSPGHKIKSCFQRALLVVPLRSG